MFAKFIFISNLRTHVALIENNKAYIDSVCDDMWGYGITSDVTGRLSDLDETVLFDMFIVAHEVGHSLGSGHTFDSYDPPVDRCNLCSEANAGATIEGLPSDNAATIMSYCNFCQGELLTDCSAAIRARRRQFDLNS